MEFKLYSYSMVSFMWPSIGDIHMMLTNFQIKMKMTSVISFGL